MLKQRVMTAIILIPIFILLVLKLSPAAFCVLTGVIVFWGAWEWSFFMGVKKFPQCLIYPLLILPILALSAYVHILYFLCVALVGWIGALALVKTYPKSSFFWARSLFWQGLMGIMVLVPCWLALNLIRNAANGPIILLFLFILIWGADIGAYFSGRAWGKHKLAPLVSPGKTWEGLIGALGTTLVIALGSLIYFQIPYSSWLAALALAVVTVLFSILGDLFESMLKRNAGLKDSGYLLPGHGGILDRIDSLTAAAPVFAVGAILMGKIFH